MSIDQAIICQAAQEIRDAVAPYLRLDPAQMVHIHLEYLGDDPPFMQELIRKARTGDALAQTVLAENIANRVRNGGLHRLTGPIVEYAEQLLTDPPPLRRGKSRLSTWPTRVAVSAAVGIGMAYGLKRTRNRHNHGNNNLSACGLAKRELEVLGLHLSESRIERMSDPMFDVRSKRH